MAPQGNMRAGRIDTKQGSGIESPKINQTKQPDLLEVLSNHALLFSAAEQFGLLDYSLRLFIEAIAIAVRASRHARGDNRFAPLAHFEVLRCRDDLRCLAGALR